MGGRLSDLLHVTWTNRVSGAVLLVFGLVAIVRAILIAAGRT